MNSPKLLIELKNVSKSYKWKFTLSNNKKTFFKYIKTTFLNVVKNILLSKKRILIRNLNLKIFEGERIALIGKNGAGKTTLANIICGYQKQTSGDIFHYYKYDKHPKEKISIQFQSGSFPQNLFVSDILELSKMTSKISNYNDNRLYNLLDIKKILNRKVKNLSGGEKQRLILFTSLITNPLLLILDEYSNNLDSKSKQEISDYLTDFLKNNPISLIIISHDAEQIYHFAKKIYFMKNGIIEQKIDNIKTKFPTINDLHKFIVNNI